MAYIAEDEISNIRSSINIIDVIGGYIPLTGKGKNYFGVCPFHDDHSPSMSVSVDKQIYKCFSCGASGNVFTFVQNYEKVTFIEAVHRVANLAGISLNVKTQINADISKENDIATEHKKHNKIRIKFCKSSKNHSSNNLGRYVVDMSTHTTMIKIKITISEKSEV